MSSILMSLLTTTKYLLLRSPLRVTWGRHQAHVICGVLWAVFVIVNIVALGTDTQHTVIFNYITYNVAIKLESSFVKDLVKVTIGVSTILPTIMVVFSTLLILHHLIKSRSRARRVGGRVRWQGIVTILATATVYCVSIIPFILFYSKVFADLSSHGKVTFARVFISFTALNIMSNFYIYSLTIKSFRRHVRVCVFGWVRWFYRGADEGDSLRFETTAL